MSCARAEPHCREGFEFNVLAVVSNAGNAMTDPDERVVAMLGARSASPDHLRGNTVATGTRSLTST